MDKLFNEVPLVSEPLIRRQLMKLYNERRDFGGMGYAEYTRRIQEMEQELHELKKKLNGNH